jgi:hypothetical protein
VQEAGPIKALFQVYESEPVLSFPSRMTAASLRFVVSPIFIPLNALTATCAVSPVNSNSSTVKVWAALAVQHAAVLYRRAEDLATLMSHLRADCLQALPHSTILMLHTPEIWAGDFHCQVHWGPEDIAAECWLEAANALQLPVAELAMDFEVHSSLEGHWLANYRACPQSLVKAYVAQLNALDLQPDAITCSSQMNELGQAWGLQPGVMAEAFRLPCSDELASHYFNLFKEDTPC